MNLLAAKLYDPASAASKNTTQTAAMTAFDTTNLRLTFTPPAHGLVRFRMQAVGTGSTQAPVILMGVLNTTNVVGRAAPAYFPNSAASTTQLFTLVSDFIATGVTAVSSNFDAAWAVQQAVAGTNIRYGGPNNTTAATAWGAFCFEAWDPQPNPTNFGSLSVDASGRVDVIKVAGTTQTARDLGAQLDVAVSTRAATTALPTNFSALSINANGRVDVIKIAGTTQTARDMGAQLDVAVSTRAATTALPTNFSAMSINASGQIDIIKVAGTTQTARDLGAQLDATVSSRMATFTLPTNFSSLSIDASGRVDIAKVAGTTQTASDLGAQLDATISSRMATFTLPTNFSSLSVDASGRVDLAKVAGTTQTARDLGAQLDAAISTRLSAASYTAPDNASITAVKAKTDSLTFTKALELDVNLKSVTGTTITGSGTTAAPWGP